MILLSDIDRIGQRQLLDAGMDLESDLVIAGIPSSHQLPSPDFIRRLHPKVLVLGNPRDVVHHEKQRHQLNELRRCVPLLVPVDESQSVRVSIRNGICTLELFPSGDRWFFSHRTRLSSSSVSQ